MNTEDAEKNFLISKNIELDLFADIEPEHELRKEIEEFLEQQFKEHFKNKMPKYWDKVTKRYITAFSRLKSLKILQDLPSIYRDHSGLRPNLLFYLANLGYSETSSKTILIILNELRVFDDLSIVQVVHLLTNWEIPRTSNAMKFLEDAEKAIKNLTTVQKKPSGFYALLWFKAKYSSQEYLLHFIKKYDNLWKADAFLRRQATAILSRLLSMNSEVPHTLLTEQIASGAVGTVSVANQIAFFELADKLEPRMDMYLFPTKKQRIYPLGKFLVLCSALNSEKIRQSNSVAKKISEHIHDPYYRHWIVEQYGIKL
ncbi:hypothetical protein [Thiofilum flexile]|uniref:hypothetical protein n=1 Tax=Thiofilum flexile TaxID=125627 RepID=UPI0013A54C5C|nr:hypothetical protein [Thiofilum flexile]